MAQDEEAEGTGNFEGRWQRSEEELQEFTRMIAHNLRTALRTVTAHAQLLQQKPLEQTHAGKLSSEAAQSVTYILEGIEQLKLLADGLASYAAVLAKTVEAGPSVGTETALRLALGKLREPIQQTKATITHDPLPKIPGNLEMLTHLFEHLIGNSLNYRSEETPRVHVSANRNNSDWLFSVTDNGIGIEPIYCEAIFLPFKRLHGTRRPGVGLGLTICQRIAESHGGKIWAQSKKGPGATLLISLPA